MAFSCDYFKKLNCYLQQTGFEVSSWWFGCPGPVPVNCFNEFAVAFFQKCPSQSPVPCEFPLVGIEFPVQNDILPYPGAGRQGGVDPVDIPLYQFVNLGPLSEFRESAVRHSLLSGPIPNGTVIDDDDCRRVECIRAGEYPGILDIRAEPQPAFNLLRAKGISIRQPKKVL
jgi:hypothetical protein